jgi:8-amino-7-oxononanoate synthase
MSMLLRKLISEIGFEVEQTDSPIIPIIIGKNDQAMTVADELQRAGFDVRAIRPPTVPTGTARLRISVHCDLTEDTIHSFVNALDKATAQMENRSCSVAFS